MIEQQQIIFVSKKPLLLPVNRFPLSRAYWFVLLMGCIWTLVCPSEGRAQGSVNYCVNPPPGTATGGFTLNRSRVCVNNPVSVTNTVAGLPDNNALYIFGYTGNSVTVPAPSANTTGSFTTPGSFTILQLGSLQGGGSAKCETVTVLPTEAPKFTIRNCDNRQVTLNFQFTPNTELYDQIEVDWGNGTKQAYPVSNLKNSGASNQYAPGGASYPISVRGIYNGVPDCSAPVTNSTVSPINGFASPPFISRMVVLDDTKINVTVQGPPNTDFETLLKQADGTYRTLGEDARDGSTTLWSVPTTNTPQCFQVRSISSCTPTTSEDYCSVPLAVSAGAGQNSLTWAPYTGSAANVIWKLQRNKAPLPIPGNTNKNTSSFTDDQVACNTEYCYQLIAEAGKTTYVTRTICVTGSSTNAPVALSNVTASVQDNGQVWVTTIDPNPTGVGVYTLVVSRADGPGGPFTEIGQAFNRPVFEDATANTSAQAYCYQIVLRNECGQASPPSEPACTVHLSSKTPRALDWTPASPFSIGPVDEYEIEVYDRNTGARFTTIQMGANTHREFDPDDPLLSNAYRYRIVAISPSGTTSYSNFFELQVEAGIFAPNAFNPASMESKNSRFQVRGFFSDEDFRLTIYTRWGELVYSTPSSEDSAGWDGTMLNQPAPAGTYTWRVEVRDKAGKQTVKVGSMLLIR